MARPVLTRMQDDRLRAIASHRDADWGHSPITNGQLEDLGLVQRVSGAGDKVTLTPTGRDFLGIKFKPGPRNLERQADALLARAEGKRGKRG